MSWPSQTTPRDQRPHSNEEHRACPTTPKSSNEITQNIKNKQKNNENRQNYILIAAKKTPQNHPSRLLCAAAKKAPRNKLHITDVTNASRTMLLNIHTLKWDKEILRIFNIPLQLLPNVLPSSYDFGVTDPKIFGYEIPITGIAGDQHASMFGHACFEKGMTKCTYGTGAFILTNEGNDPLKLKNYKLLNTIGFQLKQKTFYASEGSVFSTGSAIQWIKDGIKLIKDVSDTNLISEDTNIIDMPFCDNFLII